MPTEKKRNSNENDLLTHRLEEMISRMFKEQEENLIKIISANTKIMNDKFNELNRKIEEFKVSLEFTEKELKDEIKAVKIEYESEVNNLREKIREMEDRSRRNNIRVDGMKENENENWEVTKEKLQELIKNRLGIQNKVVIERAHRGKQKFKTDKPRTIVAKLLNFEDKQTILANARKLKGTGIFINEDFSRETILIRQKLWGQVKELRQQGKYAIIQYDKIVSRDFRK